MNNKYNAVLYSDATLKRREKEIVSQITSLETELQVSRLEQKVYQILKDIGEKKDIYSKDESLKPPNIPKAIDAWEKYISIGGNLEDQIERLEQLDTVLNRIEDITREVLQFNAIISFCTGYDVNGLPTANDPKYQKQKIDELIAMLHTRANLIKEMLELSDLRIQNLKRDGKWDRKESASQSQKDTSILWDCEAHSDMNISMG